jgi:hypothetical protein
VAVLTSEILRFAQDDIVVVDDISYNPHVSHVEISGIKCPLKTSSPVRVDSYTMVRGTVYVPLTVPESKFSMMLTEERNASQDARIKERRAAA